MSKRLLLLQLALTLLCSFVVLLGITPIGGHVAAASVAIHDYDEQGNVSPILDVAQDSATKDGADAVPTVESALRRADKLSVDLQQHPALERLEDSVQARGPPGARGGVTQLTRDARAYARDIQAQTGMRLHPRQRRILAQNLRENQYTRLSTEAGELHRSGFNNIKDDLIRQWETNTGQA